DRYFKTGADLVRAGKVVTRKFLVSREELRQGPGLLFQVLDRHRRVGIGFSVLPLEALPTELYGRFNELDFGIWDRGSVWSKFRQHQGEWNRKIQIVFSK